jgi:hypothetical protein
LECLEECGLDVASISDDCVKFAMQVLACKLLRKCRRDQVPAGAITVTEKCVEGVQMNWETFLVNQFQIDYREAQDRGMEFHYAWLLILIALVAWREPKTHNFCQQPISHVWQQDMLTCGILCTRKDNR